MDRYISDADLFRFNNFLKGPGSDTFYYLDNLPSIEEMFPEHVYYAIIFKRNPGSDIGHWVCLIKFSDNVFEYFDCLGKHAPNEVYDVLSRYGDVTLNQSHRQLMATNGTICGKWVMFRLMCLPNTIKQFHSFFDVIIPRKSE
jgi:hypothetical protein